MKYKSENIDNRLRGRPLVWESGGTCKEKAYSFRRSGKMDETERMNTKLCSWGLSYLAAGLTRLFIDTFYITEAVVRGHFDIELRIR